MFTKHFAVGIAALASTCGGTSSDTSTPSEVSIRIGEGPEIYGVIRNSSEVEVERVNATADWLDVNYAFESDQDDVALRVSLSLAKAEEYGFGGFERNGTVTIDLTENPGLLDFNIYQGPEDFSGVSWMAPEWGTIDVTGCLGDDIFVSTQNVYMLQLGDCEDCTESDFVDVLVTMEAELPATPFNIVMDKYCH